MTIPYCTEDALKRDESVRRKPYLDCCGKYWRDCTCTVKGKLTIGVGRNLDDVGISDDESNLMENNDLAKVRAQLVEHLPWIKNLSAARQSVFENMAFNMGVAGLLRFNVTLAFAQAGNFNAAAEAMLQSTWANQVGARAQRLSQQLKTDQWQ